MAHKLCVVSSSRGVYGIGRSTKKSYERPKSAFVLTKFGGWIVVRPDELEERITSKRENFLDDVVDHLQTTEILRAYAKHEKDPRLEDPYFFVWRNREMNRLADEEEARIEQEMEAVKKFVESERRGFLGWMCSSMKKAFYEKDEED